MTADDLSPSLLRPVSDGSLAGLAYYHLMKVALQNIATCRKGTTVIAMSDRIDTSTAATFHRPVRDGLGTRVSPPLTRARARFGSRRHPVTGRVASDLLIGSGRPY